MRHKLIKASSLRSDPIKHRYLAAHEREFYPGFAARCRFCLRTWHEGEVRTIHTPTATTTNTKKDVWKNGKIQQSAFSHPSPPSLSVSFSPSNLLHTLAD